MPIIGLSNRGLALPEIGQIRKGAKKEKGAAPRDLPYFRVEFDEMEKKSAADFLTVYGPTPTEINILMPFDDIQKMWDPWLEAYTAGRMIARSDGEFIVYQLDDKSEIIVQHGLNAQGVKVPHPLNNIAGRDQKGNPVEFKHTGRLKIIVPELKRAAYLTVMTTSIHDIGNISDQLSAFKALNNGLIAGIPLILRRRKKAISTPGPDGTRARRIKSLLSIEADPEWVSRKLTQLGALALPNVESLLLPTPINSAEPYELDEDEIDAELEADAPDEEYKNKPINAEDDPIEIIDPMGEWAVKFAATHWNISMSEAAKSIATRQLGNKFDKKEFISIITSA